MVPGCCGSRSWSSTLQAPKASGPSARSPARAARRIGNVSRFVMRMLVARRRESVGEVEPERVVRARRRARDVGLRVAGRVVLLRVGTAVLRPHLQVAGAEAERRATGA